jgi:glycosyltransferase involved in cell wall biosynthesis
MALGIPSVVTPVGGLIEQAEQSEAAIVAEEMSPQSIASALVEILSDGDLYERLSRSALMAATSTLGWPRVAHDDLKALREMDGSVH